MQSRLRHSPLQPPASLPIALGDLDRGGRWGQRGTWRSRRTVGLSCLPSHLLLRSPECPPDAPEPCDDAGDGTHRERGDDPPHARRRVRPGLRPAPGRWRPAKRCARPAVAPRTKRCGPRRPLSTKNRRPETTSGRLRLGCGRRLQHAVRGGGLTSPRDCAASHGFDLADEPLPTGLYPTPERPGVGVAAASGP
jgi:hypothetical protein